MKVINSLNKYFRKRGIELVRFPNNELKRRKLLMNHLKINIVLDIGANVGEYGKAMRELEFQGKIISFEPIKTIYESLKENVDKDPNWTCENFALGNSNGKTEINIAGNNAASSSILEMLPSHLNSAPQSKYIGKETIEIKQLDSIFDQLYKKGDNVFAKIDAQGFEKSILDGAENSLDKIKVLQVELSVIPLYKDSLNYLEMIDFLKSKNFELFTIEPGFSDPETGRLLQFDGVFVKNNFI